MGVQVEEFVKFIQEHCLWQFFSRSWDREQNINGILSLAFKILTGEPYQCETPDERCNFANANSLAKQLQTALPWLKGLGKDDLADVIAKVKAKLEDLTIKHSLNGELNQPGY
jgi:vanadium nitrogenase delta subunit